MSKNAAWLVAGSLIAAAIVTWIWNASFPAVTMAGVEAGAIATTFGGLIFIALVIERVIEVYVQPKSEARKIEIERPVVEAEAKVQSLAPSPGATGKAKLAPELTLELVKAEQELADAEAQKAADLKGAKLETMKLATPLAIIVSLIVAFAGVRALGGYITMPVGASDIQKNLLATVDVIITAGLLAGGADGLHKVLDSFLTIMDKKKEEAEQAAS